MTNMILFNKPYNVLSQFTDNEGRSTLSDFIDTQRYPDFYPAGRLDYDSEGLLILTNHGALQHQIAHPEKKLAKSYWVQVEGEINSEALQPLSRGLHLKDGITKPAQARLIPAPKVWGRATPIRTRKDIPTSWIEITLKEGKNRQVRRMTAALGFPTLRLIRVKIGTWGLENLQPGTFRDEHVHLPVSPRNQAQKKSRRHHGK